MTPDITTLVELLRLRAQQPEQTIYSFQTEGNAPDQALTSQELDRQARTIAARLQQLVGPDERALLLYPPGLEYITAFFGCLYARVIAVPAYPPNPVRLERTLPRLGAIVRDARPLIGLTTAEILPIAEMLSAQSEDFRSVRWVATDKLAADLAETWQQPTVESGSLAFLQYTSGSTSTPKGVMLTHGNLVHNSKLISQFFDHSATSQGVIWLPPYHDMGLIGGILQPLYTGFPVTLMSPMTFLQRPFTWLQAISRTGATTSGGPNFAYDLCVRKITPEQRATLDLSTWRVAFTGAEPVRAETLERFAEAFAPCGFRREAFYPCYGLAEATLIVSGGAVPATPVVRTFQKQAIEQHRAEPTTADARDAYALVGCGQSAPDQRVVIANPQTRALCAPGQIGEIWVAGPSVAQGYWERTEQTAETFDAHLDDGSGPFLRTGDLGFLQDGELYVTGRIKDLIIIRGRNYYPQDIEAAVGQSHPALRPGNTAAFSTDIDGTEQLVVVQEVSRQARELDVEQAAAAIRQTVAQQHELHVHTVVLLKEGSLPKTSSGKIQRYLARANYLAGEPNLGLSVSAAAAGESAGAPAAPLREESFIRKALAAIADPQSRRTLLTLHMQERVAQVLQLQTAQVDPQRPLNQLAFDSLQAVELSHAFESSLQVDIPATRVLEGASLADLVDEALALLAAPADAPAGPLPSGPLAPGEYPASAGQAALWFLCQNPAANAAYNLVSGLRLRGDLNLLALQSAFAQVLERHPALRTTFVARGGQPLQVVHARLAPEFQQHDASAWSAAELETFAAAEALRPFDLERGPLLRVTLLARAEQELILLFAAHHSVIDFWSFIILLEELRTLYLAAAQGRPAELPAPALHYVDYVRWQADQLERPAAQRLWSYWHQQLAAPLPVLNLPTDRPRPPAQTFCGATHTFALDAALARGLGELARRSHTTMYTLLVAALDVLLYRYTGQTDLVIGAPTAGRSHALFADTIGYFVNPVALRADLSANPTFSEFLGQVAQTVLGALKHQEYPFPLLVQQLNPERDPSRAPLFQVLFAYEKPQRGGAGDLAPFVLGQAGGRMEWDSLTIESFPVTRQTAQFDLLLTVAESGAGLAASWEYNSDLFDAATVARLAEHFQTLLAGIVAAPGRRVAELALLSAAEREQVLHTWNHTQGQPAPALALHRRFEAQAERTPQATALVFQHTRLSYAELNQRANQVAGYLREQGVGPETLVGIYTSRSPDLLIGVLGILKAGGAYVPIDPAYPRERLGFIMDDTRMPVLLTQRALADQLGACSARVVCLDSDWAAIAQHSPENPAGPANPDHLAYVIYTSGSTGRPKGVAIAHRSGSVLLDWAAGVFSAQELAGVLASTSICFDLSVFELFLPLSVGGAVILAENVLQLPQLPAASEVTLVNSVPSAITEIVRAGQLPAGVRTVCLAGEPLPAALVEQLYAFAGVERVYNLYGPSEDTTYSTWALIARAPGAVVPIGRPVAHTQAYVLDQRLQPVPPGVPGELYLGGLGLARGYLGRPELTAERFVPNPFATGFRVQGSEFSNPALNPDPWTLNPRLYRTGDLVRWSTDGQLEFLGRLDHQVKLRGYRIELNEIEIALAQHPHVQGAVVLAYEHGPNDRRLAAYVVPEPGQSLGVADLRAALKQRLPDYMVPGAFVFLEAFPLTPNGKINRRALPQPEQTGTERADTYVAPRTSLEEQIAQIWAKVLRVERVGVHDNFFELGGHSLLATQVLAQLSDTLQINIPVQSIFESTTVADLARQVETVLRVTRDLDTPLSVDDSEREEIIL